jgi:hypothetical protein
MTAHVDPLLGHVADADWLSGPAPDGVDVPSVGSVFGGSGVMVTVGVAVGRQDDALLVGAEVPLGLNGGAISTQGVALGLACAPTRESAVDRAERISNRGGY